MTDAPLVPDPEVIGAAALKSRPAIVSLATGGIGTILKGTYPAVRLALTGGAPRPVQNTGQPNLQAECWAADNSSAAEGAAAKLARTIEAEVEAGNLAGTYSAGTVVSAWVIGGVTKNPDETTSQPCYIVQIGLLTQ